MKIRKAKIEESQSISKLIILAMEDIIFEFIGEKSYDKAIEFLNALIHQKGNQYSYENCWVIILDNQIVGAALVYEGSKLNELKKPVAVKIKEMFNREFNPEDETEAGEYYIDCIGVDINQQGKGIGSKILRYLINKYVINHNQTLGLLVEKQNPKAKKLYLQLGFKVVGEKTLVGKKLEHLQISN